MVILDQDRSVRAADSLTGFAKALGVAGLPGSADRTHGFLTAVTLTGAETRDSVYWAGRATLCANTEDFPIYDDAFSAWFDAPAEKLLDSRRSQPVPDRPQASISPDSDASGEHAGQTLIAQASAEELLRHRDVATMSDAERALLARLFASLTVIGPQRRSLRRRSSRTGVVDVRRTLRAQLQLGGEVAQLRFNRRAARPRRVVLLLDVSGSMQAYADALLRLGHRIVTALPRQVEVFTIGTRLTRITPALRHRQPDEAITAAGRAVPDWSGGTRLGEVVEAFVGRWARRGPGRGAVIIIASDGWERGDPSLLGDQLRQLRLLAHSIIWMNPHRGKPGYAPIQSGIEASLPHLDRLVAGHSLAAFEELLLALADA